MEGLGKEDRDVISVNLGIKRERCKNGPKIPTTEDPVHLLNEFDV